MSWKLYSNSILLHFATNVRALYHSIVWLYCCALYLVPEAYIVRNKLKLKYMYVKNIIATEWTDNLIINNRKIMLIQLRNFESYFFIKWNGNNHFIFSFYNFSDWIVFCNNYCYLSTLVLTSFSFGVLLKWGGGWFNIRWLIN
jgi:hypothetical protein